MKKLSFEKLERIQGGDATGCGIGVGLAFFAPNPFTIGLALALCLTGDTRR